MDIVTYRKKPVEIEAVLFADVADSGAIAAWCGGSNAFAPNEVQIKTLEGTMTASVGDYIIRGVQGEFYPCKPDIFAKTYERVSLAEGAAEVVYVDGSKPRVNDEGIPILEDRPVTSEHRAIAGARYFTASEHQDVVALRELIAELGAQIEARVPAGRNKALALTALEDVQMRANRGIFAPETHR